MTNDSATGQQVPDTNPPRWSLGSCLCLMAILIVGMVVGFGVGWGLRGRLGNPPTSAGLSSSAAPAVVESGTSAVSLAASSTARSDGATWATVAQEWHQYLEELRRASRRVPDWVLVANRLHAYNGRYYGMVFAGIEGTGNGELSLQRYDPSSRQWESSSLILDDQSETINCADIAKQWNVPLRVMEDWIHELLANK